MSETVFGDVADAEVDPNADRKWANVGRWRGVSNLKEKMAVLMRILFTERPIPLISDPSSSMSPLLMKQSLLLLIAIPVPLLLRRIQLSLLLLYILVPLLLPFPPG